jgi:hypothetical protein
MRETWGKENYDFRMTFRPSGGFVLGEESICEGYRICIEAPNDRHALRECFGGFRHSIGLYRPESLNDENMKEDIQQQWQRCTGE